MLFEMNCISFKSLCYNAIPDVVTSMFRLGILEDESYIEYQRYKILKHITQSFADIIIINRDLIDEFFSIVFQRGNVHFIMFDGRSVSSHILIHSIEKHWIPGKTTVLIPYDFIDDIDYVNIEKKIRTISDMYNNMIQTSSILHVINMTQRGLPLLNNHVIKLGDHFDGVITDMFQIVFS